MWTRSVGLSFVVEDGWMMRRKIAGALTTDRREVSGGKTTGPRREKEMMGTQVGR